MREIYAASLIFRVKKPVFSLPYWHGGRWHAWFREACKMIGLKFDDLALAIQPLRFGQASLKPDEEIAVRMILPADQWNNLLKFADILRTARTDGLFSATSLGIVKIVDLANGRILWQDDRPCGIGPRLFSENALAAQVSRLRALNRFSLVFDGPLRLPAPRGFKNRQDEKYKYCQPAHFNEPGLTAHLLRRVRFLEEENGGEDNFDDFAPDLDASRLFWYDMRYNPVRQMALGGICGRIVMAGKPGEAGARRLVLGQYFGVGKNGRFGFGFWRIPEISPQTDRQSS